MVDTAILNEFIDNSGKKRGFLANKLGLSRQGFQKKVAGINDFKSNEISILCSELGITKLSDKERIFFAPNVPKNGNSEE